MNKTRNLLIATSVLLSGIGLTGLAQATPTPGPTSAPSARATADASLTKALTFSREEERMARDLYAALAAKYDGAVPMSRITLSEQRHHDSIGALLTQYGIPDPSAGRAVGNYADPTIQSLYDGWLTQGSQSLAEAYKVGIALEKRDIADLEAELKTVKQADVKVVLEHLLAGSQNHLRAFTSAAQETRPGATSTPQQGKGQQAQQGKGQRGKGQHRGMGSGHAGQSTDCPMKNK